MSILIAIFNGNKVPGGTMKYFRHLSTGRNGNRLQTLYAKFGKSRGYGLYFMLLEMCSERYNGVSERFSFRTKNLATELELRPRSCLELVQELFNSNLISSLEIDRKLGVIHFDVPDLIKISDDYSRKVRTQSGQKSQESPPIELKEDKDIKKKEEEMKAQILSNGFFKRISAENQSLLFKTYPVDFLLRETLSGSEFILKSATKYFGNEGSFLVSHYSRQWAYQNQSSGKQAAEESRKEELENWVKNG